VQATQFQSIKWALSSKSSAVYQHKGPYPVSSTWDTAAKVEGFAALTSSLPPAVGGDGGEGDVQADSDERCRACSGDDPALSPLGLHRGALRASRRSRAARRGAEKGGRFSCGGVAGWAARDTSKR
jgi:hypothetical protein